MELGGADLCGGRYCNLTLQRKFVPVEPARFGKPVDWKRQFRVENSGGPGLRNAEHKNLLISVGLEIVY